MMSQLHGNMGTNKAGLLHIGFITVIRIYDAKKSNSVSGLQYPQIRKKWIYSKMKGELLVCQQNVPKIS